MALLTLGFSLTGTVAFCFIGFGNLGGAPLDDGWFARADRIA